MQNHSIINVYTIIFSSRLYHVNTHLHHHIPVNLRISPFLEKQLNRKWFEFVHLFPLHSYTPSKHQKALTLSWWRSLSYRNQTIDLLCKSMDWFLHNRDLSHERVKVFKGYRNVTMETNRLILIYQNLTYPLTWKMLMFSIYRRV